MATIEKSSAVEHRCPFNEFRPCYGELCMAWLPSGRPFEEAETTNLVDTPDGPRPAGDPPRPEGDGWHRYGAEYARGYENSAKLKLPKATAQRWRRTRERPKGRCGRVAPDGYHDEDCDLPF